MYRSVVPIVRDQAGGSPPLCEEMVLRNITGIRMSAIALNESWPMKYAICHFWSDGLLALMKKNSVSNFHHVSFAGEAAMPSLTDGTRAHTRQWAHKEAFLCVAVHTKRRATRIVRQA
eukprot:2405515-Prymnesium_polylepis.1